MRICARRTWNGVPMRAGLLRLCATAAVLTAAAGCSNSAGNTNTALPSDTPSTTSASSTTTSGTSSAPPTSSPPTGGTTRSPVLWYVRPTGDPVKDQLQTVIQSYVSMSIRLAERPDPADPQISQLSVDPQRSAFINTYQRVRAQGLSQRGPVWGSFVSVAVTGVRAKVTTCLDLTKTQVYRSNGKPQAGSRGGEDLYIFTVLRNGNMWKVSEQDSPDQSHCRVQR
jgi:hypothetical protein